MEFLEQKYMENKEYMENIEIEIIKLGVFARSAIYLRALLLTLVTRVAGKSKSQRK